MNPRWPTPAPFVSLGLPHVRPMPYVQGAHVGVRSTCGQPAEPDVTAARHRVERPLPYQPGARPVLARVSRAHVSTTARRPHAPTPTRQHARVNPRSFANRLAIVWRNHAPVLICKPVSYPLAQPRAVLC